MRKWIANSLLLLGSVIGTLVVLEVGLQFAYPAHDTWRLYHAPDRDLGWTLEPGAEFSRQVPGGIVSVRYNSEGYRDTEHSGAPPADTIRIVVLGDSYMEANMVPLEQVFHKQLEKLGAAAGKPIKTYNLGVARYGTLQEYLAFKRDGVKRRPQIVLLAFFLKNDVRNNAENLNGAAIVQRGRRKRPFLDQSSNEWNVIKPDYEKMRKNYLKKKNSLLFRLKHKSVLLTFYRNALRARKTPAEYIRGGSSLVMHRCKTTSSIKKGWKVTERIVRRLADDTAAIGAKLLVFSVPSLAESDQVLASEFEKIAESNNIKLCMDESPGYRHLRMMMKRLDIPYIDLVPDFRKAIREGRDLFVKGDWHWNGEAHELAARRVYKTLLSK